MFSTINKILENTLSIRITKVKKGSQSRVNFTKRKLYVEFIGVSGVGKSYTLNQLDLKSNEWTTMSAFLQKKGINNGANLFIDFYEKLIGLKTDKIISGSFSNWDKLDLLTYSKLIVEGDLQIPFNNEMVVLADEGLMHHFCNEIISLFKKDQNSIPLDYFKDRIYVYCYADPERIAKQILKRQSTAGILNPRHKGKSLDELIESRRDGLENENKLIEILKTLNVPVLEVDTANDTVNKDLITSFIRESIVESD